MFEWQRRLGTDLEFASRFLQPLDSFAASAPVSDDPFDPPYRLTRLGNGQVEATSPLGDGAVTLTESEVLIHRVAFRPLCVAIAAAFGFEAAYEGVPSIPACRRLGSMRPYSGYSFAVFFLCATTPEEFGGSLAALALRWSDPFLLVVPSMRHVRSSSESLLRERKSRLLAMADLVSVNSSNELVCKPEGKSALSLFLDGVMPKKPGDPNPFTFPTPADAGWQNLSMKFMDNHTVSVRIGDVTKRLTYSDMGMCYGRSKKPTKQWELLLEFAREHGFLTWASPGAARKNSSRKQALSRNLRKFFRIDDDPIRFETQPKRGWRMMFSIEPA